MRDPFVTDRTVTQHELAGPTAGLETARRADGDELGGAQRDEVLQEECCDRGPESEAAEDPNLVVGAR